MNYLDRKHPITWTSPSGKSFELHNIQEINYSFRHYGTLTTIATKSEKDNSLAFLKKKDGSSFNTNTGDIFEDLGISGKAIPLQIIFSGDNHDTESLAFERAFAEKGNSRLQLPYNDRPIRVNAQALDKKQDLVKDIASTIIEVEFIETLQNKPLSKSNTNIKNELLESIDTKQQNNMDSFANIIEKTPADKLQSIFDTFTKNLTKISNTIGNIASGDFDAILKDIQANILNNSGISFLEQTSQFIDLGFSIISSVPYITTLLENIINDITGNLDKTNTGNITKEELITSDFFINANILSACKNITINNTSIETKKEARETAIKLQNIYQSYKEYYDITYNKINANLSLADSFTNPVNVNDIVQVSAGFLIETSFDLKTEFNITLAEDSNLIDIAYRYYTKEFIKDQNEAIDYIARTNNIKGEEFILLEKGRKITIYI